MTHEDLLSAAARRAMPRGEHIVEETAYALAAGALPERECEPIREHVARCAACSEMVRDALRFRESFGETAPATRWRPGGGILAIAASLLLIAGTATLVLRGPHIPDVVIVKAAYSPESEILVRGESPPPIVDPFDVAMKPYDAGDYATAEAQLAAHLVTVPADQRARFYRGVSLLLLDRTAEGVRELDLAARQPGALQEDARFYLALGFLRQRSARDAEPLLRDVAAVEGPHRAEAAALLEKMR
ncbi:MAG: hypothetical protein U0166_23085 [Acidobacteriota bacterium]